MIGRVVFVDGLLVVLSVAGFAGLTIFKLLDLENLAADDQVNGPLDALGDATVTVLRTGQSIRGSVVLVDGSFQ